MNAWDREALAQLRGAVARRDLPALRTALAGRDLDAVLQLAGDGLLADPSDPLAQQCAERLRRRGWDGDAELADALQRAPSDLRPLAVDLEELAAVLEADPLHGGGRIGLATGEIWHHSPYDDPIDDEDDDLDDPDRWLSVHAGSHDAWHDMAEFITNLSDPTLAQRLDRAIRGRARSAAFTTPPTSSPASASSRTSDTSATSTRLRHTVVHRSIHWSRTRTCFATGISERVSLNGSAAC